MIYEITPTSLDETQFLSSFFPAVRKWMYQGGTFNKKDLSNEDLVLLLWKNFRVPQYLPVVWSGLWMHFQFFTRGVTITFLPHRFKSAIWNSILLSKYLFRICFIYKSTWIHSTSNYIEIYLFYRHYLKSGTRWRFFLATKNTYLKNSFFACRKEKCRSTFSLTFYIREGK